MEATAAEQEAREGGRVRQLISDELSPFPPFMVSVTGQCVSGKNQQQLLFRKGSVIKYPNARFKAWRDEAALQIRQQFMHAPEIAKPVRLTCSYWPGDQRTRDVSGMLDALFFILVYAKVLEDDGLIYDVVWKRQEMNRRFPKVIMEISAWG